MSQPLDGAKSVERSRVDDEMEAIFLQHYSGVFHLLVRLVGAGQAEELANEVFFKLSRQPQRWLLTNNVGGWLYRTATHAGIDALRAAANRKRYEQAAAVEMTDQGETRDGSPLEDILREEHRRKVRSVLSGMKPAQAQLLLMRSAGSSYREIAEAAGLAVSGVGTMLNRAEAEFRKRFLQLNGEKETL